MSQGCFPFLTTYQFISTSYKFHDPLSLVKRLRLNDDETLEMQAAHQLRSMINILYACRVSSSNFPELGLIFKQTNQLKSPKQSFCKYYSGFFIRQFCRKSLLLIRNRSSDIINVNVNLISKSLGCYQIATIFFLKLSHHYVFNYFAVLLHDLPIKWKSLHKRGETLPT